MFDIQQFKLINKYALRDFSRSYKKLWVVTSTLFVSLLLLSLTFSVKEALNSEIDSSKLALTNAQNLVNAGADMVKIEGGQEHEEVFRVLSSNNINVCGHLGLQPQKVTESSEYKIQGKDENSAKLILSDALLLESLGISSLVLECIPSALAKEVSSSLNIPTIGIGAGKDCDGQVLVCYDMLGITLGKLPRFVRNFVSTEGTIPLAISAFVKEVKAGTFPSTSESY